jgi:hypothetical protein
VLGDGWFAGAEPSWIADCQLPFAAVYPLGEKKSKVFDPGVLGLDLVWLGLD